MDELKESPNISAGEDPQMSSAVAGAAGGAGVGSGSPRATTAGPQYTIPGILHFLQHEWSRFEMERSQWEVDKAELQARIAFLQGERKGQENLKNDLVRRIKMLEYALKQERTKYNKLKYGSDTSGAADEKPPTDEDGIELPPLDGENYIAVSNINWRQGRQLLRQYLQEIGCTDTIIDVRSNRVRSLLGLNDVNDVNEENRTNLAMNGGGSGSGGGAGETNTSSSGSATVRRSQQQQQSVSQEAKRGVATTVAEEMLIDTEAAVMANFDFLTSETEIDDEDDDDGGEVGYSNTSSNEMRLKVGKTSTGSTADDTEEVMGEFNFLSNPDAVDNMKRDNAEDGKGFYGSLVMDEWGIDEGLEELDRLKSLYQGAKGKKRRGLSSGGVVDFLSLSGGKAVSSKASVATTATSVGVGVTTDKSDKSGDLGNNLELGELEQLTITNDNESSYDQITAPKEAFRKTWSAKYTLRSHFDGVRALGFHPTEPVLITASEDQTLKLWNLQKTIPAKKSASLDVEPVYTFRAHRGPVLSLAVAAAGDALYSGGLDGTVRCWVMPSPSVDPYDSFEPSVLSATLAGHTDAVWGLSHHGGRGQLLSCSADGTVKLWAPSNKTQPLISTLGRGESGVPTSVDWVYEHPAHMVAAYTNASCVIYDIESGKPVIKLDTNAISSNMGAITKVISHPTLPLTITAHEDRQIRFFDNSTGKLTHAMVAHLDAVTSLSIDSNGLYLISGSHDCSVRLWNLETKTCVQEITAHRKKFDESIFDVAFHPSKPYIASAGADALAKVFV